MPRAVQQKTSTSTPTIACIDLFCGAGGLTRGLIDAGVPVVAGIDLDKTCQYPYETNNDTTFHARDVAEVTPEEIVKLFGDARIRVLAGCAPCQPFSSYAQRYETVGTERWGLLNHFARLVERVLPDIVTMENVSEVKKHQVFRDFVATLKKLDYKVWWDVVDAADYGLPQRRRRTVLLASRHGEIALQSPRSRRKNTVRKAIKGLRRLQHGKTDKQDPMHVASGLSAINVERIKHSKPGGSWRDWPPHLVANCHRKTTGKSYPGVYGRMKWDEPAPTLTTQFFGFGSGRFGHPDTKQHRGLSLREGAILQGFPKNYKFVPKGKQIHIKVLGRLIGNAVPVHLGRAIGRSIVHHLERLDVTNTKGRNGRP